MLAALVEAYATHLKAEGRSASTVRWHEGALSLFAAWLRAFDHPPQPLHQLFQGADGADGVRADGGGDQPAREAAQEGAVVGGEVGKGRHGILPGNERAGGGSAAPVCHAAAWHVGSTFATDGASSAPSALLAADGVRRSSPPRPAAAASRGRSAAPHP